MPYYYVTLPYKRLWPNTCYIDKLFSESPCLCMLNPFFLIHVMKPSLHPLAVIST